MGMARRRCKSAILGLLLAGCGRVGFAPLSEGDGGVTAPVDAAGDGASVGPDARPFASCVLYGDPVRLDGLDLGEDQATSLSADGLEIMFHSSSSAFADTDIYVARRLDVSSSFVNPMLATDLSTTSRDETPALAPAGRSLYFASSRTPILGGAFDIWSATRPAPDQPWSGLTHEAALSSTDSDGGATTTADGLEVFLHRSRQPDLSDLDIYCATRSSPTDVFDNAARVNEIDSPGRDLDPWISPDGLVLYFASEMTGTLGNADLWLATRPDRSSPFATIRQLETVNTNGIEIAPWPSADGRTLYFTSDRGGTFDLWAAPCIE